MIVRTTLSFVTLVINISPEPIIFALSNPTSKSECTAEQAYNWTKGRAVFVSGSPFESVTYKDQTFYPGQGNNAYIFPGVGLGVVVSKSSWVMDDMFIAAADTLTDLVSEEDLAKGRLYPSLIKIREISCKIAVNVAKQAFENHTARVPQPENLEKCVRDSMFLPKYKSFV